MGRRSVGVGMKTYKCSNPAKWHPTLHRTEVHHSPPRSWTPDDGASSELMTICGLCHNEIHSLLNEYVRAEGTPTWSVRRSYGVFFQRAAEKAWEKRGPRTPYTTTEGEA